VPLIRLLAALAMAATTAGAQARHYDLTYRAQFLPDAGVAAAAIEVEQEQPGLTLLDLNAPAVRYTAFEGDGPIRRDGDRLIWEVPPQGGTLRYRVRIDHQRDGAWDARLTDDWAIARLDDVFPPARSRSRAGAGARTRLQLSGPQRWSFETRYGPVGPDGVQLDTSGRRLDRPLGWMAAGDLGIRRTRIGAHRIAIAGPKDEDFRRMDVLTFLRWTMPELLRVAPSFPQRLLIVGGSQDMWRGGLSGPGSLYVHPDRPLVSGNATSTLLHELMHVATEEPPAAGDDWIVEGLAEYYASLILLRTGGISESRFEDTLTMLRDWSEREGGSLTDPSTGADTARAVLLFHALDEELAAAGSSLDAVAAKLLAGRVSRERLVDLARAELGRRAVTLDAALCH
jgi:hypothetical protein